MKKIFTAFVMVVLWHSISLMSGSAEDQATKIDKGEMILALSIQASGGRDNLLEVRDTTIVSDLKIISTGLTTSRVSYMKGFEKVRVETTTMGATTILSFNGKTGWVAPPETTATTDMPKPLMVEIKKTLRTTEAQIDPDKFGIKTTFEGKRVEGGKTYLVLKQVYKDKDITILYLDPKTYLPYKTIALSLNNLFEEVETETIISDYRDIGGMQIPFYFKIIQDGRDYATITVNSYKCNAGLKDSFFERPQK